jgi:hypothetical protein
MQDMVVPLGMSLLPAIAKETRATMEITHLLQTSLPLQITLLLQTTHLHPVVLVLLSMESTIMEMISPTVLQLTLVTVAAYANRLLDVVHGLSHLGEFVT